MLNESEVVNHVKPVLESLLKPVPFVKGVELIWEPKLGADFIFIMNIGTDELKLVGEVKNGLQPRFVMDSVRQIKEHCSYFSGESVYPVIVSEYISPRSAEIIINQNVSYFDLSGNCHLCFANVYIDREGKKSKSAENRGVKSLFGLKSSRMLRLMLSKPQSLWQVKELAAKTELSFGQVSNIRRALLDQQYASESKEGGICLFQPEALMDAWRKVYKKNEGIQYWNK